jgi:hypothetical protein
MTLRGRDVDRAKFARRQAKLLGLKSREYRAEETPLNGVRFDDDQCSFHEVKI